MLSRTLTSPLEVVKVLAQVGTPETRLGFVRSFGRIYQSEGLKAFWKGNGISCLRLVPYSAVQLAAFHKMLVSLLPKTGESNSEIFVMIDVFILQALLEDPLTPGNLNGTYSMAAGSGSALVAAFLVYPADMLKTRLIVQNISPSKSHYRGIVHGFRKVWKAEGFPALYKGLLPTFLGECFRSLRNSLGQVNNNSCFCMYCLGNMAFFKPSP